MSISKENNVWKKWKRKHGDKLPWLIIFGVVFTLYLGGIVTQVTHMNNFTEAQVPFSFHPFYCIAANFTIGLRGLVLVFIAYICAGVFLFLQYKDKNKISTEDDVRGFKRETSGVHGTSKLLSPEEARDFCEVEPLDRTTGMILGRFSSKELISIPPDGKRIKRNEFGDPITKVVDGKVVYEREKLKTNGNQHCTVMGASGSGKSHCYGRPAIFQSIRHGRSVIVTDPKGELFSDTSEFAKQHGYTVKILNLANPPTSDSWDALAELKSSSQIGIEAQKFCSIIIDNTTNPNAKGDEVYANGEKNLLTALVLYVLTAQSYNGPKTLGAVYDLLCRDEDTLDSMFSVLPEGSIALRPWSIFKGASPALRGNLILGAGVRLQVLQDEVIKAITGYPDIDLIQPGRSKCAYYVIMPDMNSTFTFISSLFFSCLFDKLIDFSRMQQSQKLPVSINVIMDEFIAIGKLPDWDKKLATVRSAGINISMIFQTLAQLQNAYPNGLWESLLANCYTCLCLSCNDMTTAEYLSKRSGLTTVALETIRVDKPLIDIANIPTTVSHSYSTGERAVMQPAEIISLSAENQILISIAGADLIVADKFPYTEMVDPDELVIVNMYNHTPGWATQMQYRAQLDTEEQTWSAYEKKQTPSLQPTAITQPTQSEPPARTESGTTDDDFVEQLTQDMTPPPTPDSDFDEAPPQPTAPVRSQRTTDDDFSSKPAAPEPSQSTERKTRASFSRSNLSSSSLSDF